MKPRPRASRPAPALLLVLALTSATTALAAPLPVPVAPSMARAAASPLLTKPAALTPRIPNTADGEWEEFGLLQVYSSLGIYDAAEDELLSVGGSRTESWALALSGSPAWSALPEPAAPWWIQPGTATFDPATRVVYFLGYGAGGLDVFALDPRTGALGALGAAAADGPNVEIYSLVFDPAHQRIMLVGRSIYAPIEELQVWALDVAAPVWVRWTVPGSWPDLYPFGGLLDPVRRKVLFPRGSDIVTLSLDGTPAWDTHASNDGVGAQGWVYDAATDRIWAVDNQGRPNSLSPINYLWTQHAVAGGPSPRVGVALAIDTFRHRLLVAGGTTQDRDDVFSDTWALSLDGPLAWTQLVPGMLRTPVRGGSAEGYDPSRNRLVLFSGANSAGQMTADTWALNLGATPGWAPIATQGGPPPGRYWTASAWDDLRDRLVVFGGYDGSDTPLGDLWALSFAGGTPTWSPIAAAGPAPPARALAQMVRDPIRDRLLLMFGWGGGATVLGDVWELKFTPSPAWRKLTPSGTAPQARSATMCVFDAVLDRLLVFGGSTTDNGGDYRNDFYALQFGVGDGAWQALSPATPPSGRNLGLLRYDSARRRLLLFGGYGIARVEGNTTYIEYLDDTWELPLTGGLAWRRLQPAGPTPPGRDRANGVYDPHRDRLILTCGGASGFNDTWALNFADAPTPTLVSLVATDVTGERVRLIWAGADAGTWAHLYRRAIDDEWQMLGTLRASGEGRIEHEDRSIRRGTTYEYRIGIVDERGETLYGLARVSVPAYGLGLAARSTDGVASFAVELPTAEPAKLALFDLAGRSVWSRDLGGLGAGSHHIDTDDASLVPGLYFARLTFGRESRFVRLVLVR